MLKTFADKFNSIALKVSNNINVSNDIFAISVRISLRDTIEQS